MALKEKVEHLEKVSTDVVQVSSQGPENGARIGLVPRHDDDFPAIRWFDVRRKCDWKRKMRKISGGELHRKIDTTAAELRRVYS